MKKVPDCCWILILAATVFIIALVAHSHILPTEPNVTWAIISEETTPGISIPFELPTDEDISINE